MRICGAEGELSDVGKAASGLGRATVAGAWSPESRAAAFVGAADGAWRGSADAAAPRVGTDGAGDSRPPVGSGEAGVGDDDLDTVSIVSIVEAALGGGGETFSHGAEGAGVAEGTGRRAGAGGSFPAVAGAGGRTSRRRCGAAAALGGSSMDSRGPAPGLCEGAGIPLSLPAAGSTLYRGADDGPWIPASLAWRRPSPRSRRTRGAAGKGSPRTRRSEPRGRRSKSSTSDAVTGGVWWAPSSTALPGDLRRLGAGGSGIASVGCGGT